MSRAFVKEDSDGPESLPERTISALPNYMTPAGYHAMQRRHAELIVERDALASASGLAEQARLPMLERDIRYYQARLRSAQVVAPSDAAPEKVIFGRRVEFVDGSDRQYAYRIVGEDEALEHLGHESEAVISWASPLGRALLGCEEGDVATWSKPSGDLEIEIVEVTP